MAQFEIIMPKLGESIQEATITKWFVKEGDTIAEDDLLFEVATDKVDSEIPSPVEGTVVKILYPENALVPVGEVLAIINMSGEDEEPESPTIENSEPVTKAIPDIEISEGSKTAVQTTSSASVKKLSNRFYSPLVKKIALEENLSIDELETIAGSGANGRVQKSDILNYLDNRKAGKIDKTAPSAPVNLLHNLPDQKFRFLSDREIRLLKWIGYEN
jgi:2-oxoglutarate dehydrogenase E2 component (dihydrolipoamide succinyltransferase)